ncbi:TetR/AcrR family transcriptional regulator [Desulfatitalea tepidiphila]|uniref:TetR/AcrR family transcriptional regulator n=1 Tax=Desulfatitalea tepidiphila TaxID=1185843 RepID=UPI0006B4563A|nr:TetR/AcrR family transcriptional regulator [Desulfatitalea tepidiphila]
MGIQERKEREKERRRQQIMVAAKRIFANKGFGRATMEDIANEAELSPGTLYLYFRSKDELCVSLSLRVLEYLLIRMEHLNDDKQLTPFEKIVQLKKALLDVYEFDPSILTNLFYLQSNDTINALSPELKAEIDKLSGTALGKISSIFEKAIEEGTCMDWSPEGLAKTIWSTFYGIVLWEKGTTGSEPDVVQLGPLVDRAFQVFERGIRR